MTKPRARGDVSSRWRCPLSARPLGLFAALAVAPPAFAGEPTVDLTYEPTPTADGYEVKIYAKNLGQAVVMVDDEPFIERAVIQGSGGTSLVATTETDTDMISRAGPIRKWMAVQPGEKLLVGTSKVGVPVGTRIEGGVMTLTVRLVTMDGWSEQVDLVPLGARPAS